MATYQQPRNGEDYHYQRLDEPLQSVHQNHGTYPTTVPPDGNYDLHPRVEKGLDQERPYFHTDHSDDDEYFKTSSEERKDFVAKVYGIVSVQLILTSIVILMALASPSFSHFLLRNTWFFILCMIGTVVTELMIVCSPSIARGVPRNYICLFVFTFFESMVVATFCVMVNDPFIVFVAAVMT